VAAAFLGAGLSARFAFLPPDARKRPAARAFAVHFERPAVDDRSTARSEKGSLAGKWCSIEKNDVW
jgi:hypothetical protein